MPKPGSKILIIDYEPRGIKQLEDPLTEAGFEVLVAKDGIVGVEVFHDQRPDLVLIEAMLPKRHGFEVCGELKKTPHGQRTPVVIVTSVYKGRKYRSQAKHQHHCDEYLEKPISPELLLDVVRRLLDRDQGPAESGTSVTTEPTTSPAAAATSQDSVESEINDRLDELLGGGGSGGSTG
jgi:DNA-binding response OmpR family regulator